MELFQPPIGLSKSLVFQFVELFQPQEEMPGPQLSGSLLPTRLASNFTRLGSGRWGYLQRTRPGVT